MDWLRFGWKGRGTVLEKFGVAGSPRPLKVPLGYARLKSVLACFARAKNGAAMHVLLPPFEV